MILPTKHLRPERALVVIGAEILDYLDAPQTITSLWHRVRDKRAIGAGGSPISYSWYVLTLDFLFLIGAVDFERGLIARSNP